MPAITLIISSIRRIYHNPFKCIYLKNQKLFVNILMHFLNLDKVFNIFKINVEPHSLSISEIIHCKKWESLNA